jgi:ABC-type transport system involved in multi-copper enzyme maturation permease subunit
VHQVLHIFRKDCRQFWPEIVSTLVLTLAFVWAYPYQWASPNDPRFSPDRGLLDLTHLQILASVITGLLPVTWFFLTARVVHAENLIGTRQFWVTRPYDWKKLLAEKFFFLLVFLYVPFASAQLALLGRAGFAPLHYLPGLLFNLLLLTGICVLPFLSFAAVVSSIPRMLLVLLTIGIIACISAFIATSFHTEKNSIQIPHSDRVSIPLVVAICTAALVAQYSGRHLWLARGLMLTLMATIVVLAIDPLEMFLFDRAYVPFNAQQALPIQVDLSTNSNKGIAAESFDPKKVSLEISDPGSWPATQRLGKYRRREFDP